MEVKNVFDVWRRAVAGLGVPEQSRGQAEGDAADSPVAAAGRLNGEHVDSDPHTSPRSIALNRPTACRLDWLYTSSVL
jgi:hypothetical protein